MFPFRRYSVHSSLSPSEIEEGIKKNATLHKYSVSQASFKVREKIRPFCFSYGPRHKSIALPIARGELSPDENGTTVKITMRMHLCSVLISMVWMAFALYMLFTAICLIVAGEVGNGIVFGLFSCAFVGAFLGLDWLAFRFLSNELSAELNDIFKVDK